MAKKHKRTKLGLEIKKTKQKKTHSKEDNLRATIEVDVVRHVKFEQCFTKKDDVKKTSPPKNKI